MGLDTMGFMFHALSETTSIVTPFTPSQEVTLTICTGNVSRSSSFRYADITSPVTYGYLP